MRVASETDLTCFDVYERCFQYGSVCFKRDSTDLSYQIGSLKPDRMPDTSPYDFQRYIFPNKTNITGHDLSGMYAVTCGYQFSPGYR